jgi:cell volume regulation protein A
VVLATFPVLAGVPHSGEFFNIVFFAVLVSTILQGTTVEPLARRLGLTEAEPAHGVQASPLAEAGALPELGAEVVEYTVGEGDAIVGSYVRDLGLPRTALISVIVRGDDAVPPRGSTTLLTDDHLHVVVRRENAAEVDALFARWRRDDTADSGDAIADAVA